MIYSRLQIAESQTEGEWCE